MTSCAVFAKRRLQHAAGQPSPTAAVPPAAPAMCCAPAFQPALALRPPHATSATVHVRTHGWRPRRAPRLARRTRRAAATMGASGGAPGGRGEKPDGGTITEALEMSFRAVWLRLLSSGVGREYEDAITAFVVASVAAYKAGYSLTALRFELAAREKRGTVMGQDVGLSPQEKETRLVWLALVYLTLQAVRFPAEQPVVRVQDDLKGSTLEALADGLAALVDSICKAERKGLTLETFKLELSMQKAVGQNDDLTKAQASIRSQWSRIIFSTLRILPESLKDFKL